MLLGESNAFRRVLRERGDGDLSGGIERAGVLICSWCSVLRSPPGTAAAETTTPTDGVTPVPALAVPVTQEPDGVTPVSPKSSKAEGAGGACRGRGPVVVWPAGADESSASSASSVPAGSEVRPPKRFVRKTS